MIEFATLDPVLTSGKAKTLLDAVKTKLGIVPNMTRVMAAAPAALDGYLAFNGALAGGSLSAKVRELVALTVAEANLCGYCLSAHTAIGAKVGLSEKEIAAGRRASSSDPKTKAILGLARAVVIKRADVGQSQLEEARAAGVSQAEIIEVVANVALNVYTNYLNLLARTPIDFPEVKPGA
jgi:uncharacterized peroxidase-related enzyme